MKIALLGNCQIAPLRILLKALHPPVEIVPLPAVHTMDQRHKETVEKCILGADWVVAQLIADDYPVDFARTSTIRAQAGGKLVVWPNLYFAGYAPEYNTIRDASYRNFTGPLLGYHSDKILFGFFTGLDVAATVELLSSPSPLDDLWYRSSVETSFANLEARERSGDIEITDFIRDRFAVERLFYIMNHPSLSLLQELACRIFRRIGVRCQPDVPSSYFMDAELVSAIHPVNAYIHREHGLQFANARYYRGTKLVAADNVLGSVGDCSLIYDEISMVEAMFQFYNRHSSRLREHGRIREILKRPRLAKGSNPN